MRPNLKPQSGTRIRVSASSGESRIMIISHGRSKAIESAARDMGLSSHDKYILSKDGEISYTKSGIEFKVEILETKLLKDLLEEERISKQPAEATP